MARKSGLGRGLSALIPEGAEKEHNYIDIDLDLIDPNPEQPRHQFDPEKLQELAASIRHNGVIQPVIVTRRGPRYTLVAGERRWRAAQVAGYDRIPAIVRTVEPGQMLTLALLENIQRQELNPVEEAQAYKILIERHRFTHETLAENLGKSRAGITNTLRLLKLPQDVQDLVQDGRLSFGHAKCLIGIADGRAIKEMAEACLKHQWSVRQLERKMAEGDARKTKRTPATEVADVFLKKAEQAISERLGSKVRITGSQRRGKIVISYKNSDELQRVFELLADQEGMEA